MKPQLHYGEDDCPVSASDNFPKDDELHFEIEMIDFFKAKVSLSIFNSSFVELHSQHTVIVITFWGGCYNNSSVD